MGEEARRDYSLVTRLRSTQERAVAKMRHATKELLYARRTTIIESRLLNAKIYQRAGKENPRSGAR